MKAWGGRFQKETASLMNDFHSSIHFDYQLAEEDIEGSIAHAEMLGKTGIISPSEAETIVAGLTRIRAGLHAGEVVWDAAAEDIHLNIEKLLIGEIGDLGKKLHTARSRNDQVALDIRLYLRKEIGEIQKLLRRFFAELFQSAARESRTIMPGYTHLQRAQPVLLGHHLLAYWKVAAGG
jgi:argininosuccinate lyase